MLPLTARNLARWDEKNSAPTIERIPIAASQGQKSLEVNCGLFLIIIAMYESTCILIGKALDKKNSAPAGVI